jgi:hypothetical protein
MEMIARLTFHSEITPQLPRPDSVHLAGLTLFTRQPLHF